MILAISHLSAVLIGAAALAAILAVLVAAVGYRLVGRSAAVAETRTANLLEDLRTRIDGLRQEVSEALEQARDDVPGGPFDDVASIDLETVLGQVLAAARAVPGVDAALVTVARPDGHPQTKADGLTSRDEQIDPLWPPPPGRLRAMKTEYASPAERSAGDPAWISTGLAVPIRAEPETEPEPEADVETPPQAASPLETIGLLSVFARSDRGAFSEAEVHELEELGRAAAPRVRNALRLHDAEQRAVTDPQTGLRNKASFYKALATEVRRAVRHKRPLALLTFDLDDFKAINDRYGHTAADEVVTEIAKRMTTLARPEDVLCRTGAGDEFAVILPESTLDGAVKFYERLREEIAGQPLVHVGRVPLSAGIAELWAEAHESDSAFFKRAGDAQRQAKHFGKGRVALSMTLAQAAEQAAFTVWVPERVPPEWATRVTYLPSLGVPSVTETVLISYASAIEGDQLLFLTEGPPAGSADGEAGLRVERGGTPILLESRTAGNEWLTKIAETLVPVPVEPTVPPA